MDFFPKCLYGDSETLVLENVVLDDTFIMLPKADRQDLYTAKYFKPQIHPHLSHD